MGISKTITISLLLFTTFAYCQRDVFDVARSGSLEEMKALYTIDSDTINKVNKNKHTPLILACYRGNIEVAKFLIDNVDNLDFVSGEGSALMAAIYAGQIELAKLLVRKGSNPNIADLNGTTALHYAVRLEDEELVKLLLSKGAKSNVKNSSNQSPMDIAVIKKNKQLIEILKKGML